MVEFIQLVNDISTPVKLGWVGVLLWGIVQFMWYQRGRALAEDLDVETASEPWSVARLLAVFTRSAEDDAAEQPTAWSGLSIAPALDPPTRETSAHEGDLGAAAGIALESLLDGNEPVRTDGDKPNAFDVHEKRGSYEPTVSY
jgi:hypothetical protein